MICEYPPNFARFYDVIYHELRNNVDHNFFLNGIKQTRGRILEIGVGTGRFFIDALNTGSDVYGIDISQHMLDVLKGKLDKSQHYRISQQSITDFRFDMQFDLIIAPFRVFQHLPEKGEQMQALNNVCRHLKPGGKFIFDTFVPDLELLIKGIDQVTDFEGEYEPGKMLKRTVSTRPDLINQLIKIHFRLEWEENDTIKYEDWDVPLRFYFRYELEHLAERSDFKQYRILGDYQGNKLNKDSKEFIMVCS
jgi:SAM-dependent methyltransferase